MSTTWHTLIIRAPRPEDRETFQLLSRQIGAIPAAEELNLEITNKTLKVQKGASLILRQGLYATCRTDPTIVWCSLRGPRSTYYSIKGGSH